MTFRDGSTNLASVSLSGGQATYTTSALSVANHSITAVYSGDTAYAGSTSNPLTQTVNPAATSTALAASTTSVLLGNSVTFTATASDPDAGQSLTFSLGVGAPAGASIDPNTGVFTWTPADSFASPQSVTITVTDNGAPAGSDSETIQITVNNVPPTASVNADYVINEGSTLSLLASGSDPAGTTFDPKTTANTVMFNGYYRWVADETTGGSWQTTARMEALDVSDPRITVSAGSVGGIRGSSAE